MSVRPRSTLQRLIRRHTRQPLSSLHICASTHPSTCEHQHDMLRCMAKGWHAWHRYQRRAARARERRRVHTVSFPHKLQAGAVHLRNGGAHSSSAVQSFCTRSSYFNGDRDLPCCGPRCYRGLRAVQCRGSARAFAACLIHLLEKRRSTVGKDIIYQCNTSVLDFFSAKGTALPACPSAMSSLECTVKPNLFQRDDTQD